MGLILHLCFHPGFHLEQPFFVIITTLEIQIFLIVLWHNGDISQNWLVVNATCNGSVIFIHMVLLAILPTHSREILL